jgi:hypothetical protein
MPFQIHAPATRTVHISHRVHPRIPAPSPHLLAMLGNKLLPQRNILGLRILLRGPRVNDLLPSLALRLALSLTLAMLSPH